MTLFPTIKDLCWECKNFRGNKFRICVITRGVRNVRNVEIKPVIRTFQY